MDRNRYTVTRIFLRIVIFKWQNTFKKSMINTPEKVYGDCCSFLILDLESVFAARIQFKLKESCIIFKEALFVATEFFMLSK